MQEEQELYLTSANLQKFVKSCLLAITTSVKIDRRSDIDVSISKKSPLAESIKIHRGDFNKGIASLCDSIVVNEEVIEIINTIAEIHGAEEDVENDPFDKLFDHEADIYDKIMELIGLPSIHLCADEDDLKHQLLECIFDDEDEDEDAQFGYGYI